MRFFAFLLLFLASLMQVHAEDLLEPEQAFKFSAQQTDADTLEVHYQIADGYYMYRERFKFSLSGGTLATPQFPAGKLKSDPTFGKVETYQHEVRIKLPFTRSANATSVTLNATSQGCAEAGVCYTPMDSVASIPLTAAASPAQTIAPPPPLMRWPVCAHWATSWAARRLSNSCRRMRLSKPR